jgi:acetaldehyde/propanal dehydrogenase
VSTTLLPHLAADDIRIAFDATSAYVHAENARKLRDAGVVVIDLTPAAIGPFCVPPVNLAAHAGRREMNVNMVTCGGQATIPIVCARVAGCSRWSTPRSSPRSLRSRPARVRARTSTSSPAPPPAASNASAARQRGKAIIILNPAEPPLIMRDTVHCLTGRPADTQAITRIGATR